MCWPIRRCWLPALTTIAALLPASPLILGQSPAQGAASLPVQTENQPAAQTLPQAAAPVAGAASAVGAYASVPVVAPQPPPTPEEVGDSMMAHQRYQAAIEAYKKAPRDSPNVWNKMGISYQLMLDAEDASRCYQA